MEIKDRCRPSLGAATALGHGHETSWSLKLRNISIFHAKNTAKVIGSNHRNASLSRSVWGHLLATREDQLYLDHPQQVFA